MQMQSHAAPPPPLANQACHSCRRQRLRCDRAYPHCSKCLAAGRDCLGYGKLLKWTGAVASRGKLAGCTSSAPLVGPDRATTRLPTPRSRSRSRPTPTSSKSRPTPTSKSSRQAQASEASPPAIVSRRSVSSPWVLADPLVQDLEPSQRYYMFYFSQRVCRDFVSYDAADHNPFRRLLPVTKAHPLLRHTIVALSAEHMSGLVRALARFSGNKNSATLAAGAQEASTRTHRDALNAKHKALALMRGAVQDLDAAGGDVVLAAALFLVNLEQIESGNHAWKAHLEGAGMIMPLLQPAIPGNTGLRDIMLYDLLIYFIRSSQFLPGAFNIEAILPPSQIRAVLERANANSYLCCPPEVLSILHEASLLLTRTSGDALSQDQAVAAGLALLQRAYELDVDAWARDAQNTLFLRGAPMESRIHAAYAHRLTACLYILRAIPYLSTMNGYKETVEQLAHDIIQHLSSIPDDDPNLKATIWPTFVAGAEMTSRAKREWIMNRLQAIILSCPWGFLYATMDTLRTIWSLTPEGQGSATNWVEVLKGDGLKSLIF